MTFEQFEETVRSTVASALPGVGVTVKREEGDGRATWHVIIDGEAFYGTAWGMAFEPGNMLDFMGTEAEHREHLAAQILSTLSRKRQNVARAT